MACFRIDLEQFAVERKLTSSGKTLGRCNLSSIDVFFKTVGIILAIRIMFTFVTYVSLLYVPLK